MSPPALLRKEIHIIQDQPTEVTLHFESEAAYETWNMLTTKYNWEAALTTKSYEEVRGV